MNRQTNRCGSHPRRERGAALIVGLVLLMVLTVLAISSMNTATTGLTQAGNYQFYENAFQTAESGLDEVLGGNQVLNTAAPFVIAEHPVMGAETVQSTTTFVCSTPAFDPAGSSVGAFSAFHFQAVATANPGLPPGDRRTGAVHNQEFFVLGPQDQTATFPCP